MRYGLLDTTHISLNATISSTTRAAALKQAPFGGVTVFLRPRLQKRRITDPDQRHELPRIVAARMAEQPQIGIDLGRRNVSRAQTRWPDAPDPSLPFSRDEHSPRHPALRRRKCFRSCAGRCRFGASALDQSHSPADGAGQAFDPAAQFVSLRLSGFTGPDNLLALRLTAG